MNIGTLLVMAHVLTAFWFVAGIVGRGVVLGRARGARTSTSSGSRWRQPTGLRS